MKMAVAALVAVAAAVSLSGCATVFEGTSQEISVVTNPPGAVCAFDRQGMEVGRIQNTPGTANIRKSKYDLTIKCSKPGYADAQYLNHSGTTATIAGNVAADLILTAGISSIVDSADGADNKYDSAVNITLIPEGAQPGAVPTAAPSAQPALVPATYVSSQPASNACGRIGISGSTVSAGSTAAMTMSNPHGAFISEVTPGSSADHAGLKPGDVIQTFNGLRVSTYDDLNDLLGKSAVGGTVQLGVWRGQKSVSISVGT